MNFIVIRIRYQCLKSVGESFYNVRCDRSMIHMNKIHILIALYIYIRVLYRYLAIIDCIMEWNGMECTSQMQVIEKE